MITQRRKDFLTKCGRNGILNVLFWDKKEKKLHYFGVFWGDVLFVVEHVLK